MNELMSQITVLVVVGMIVFAGLTVFGVLPQRKKGKTGIFENLMRHGEGVIEDELSGHTRYFATLIMEQLDEKGNATKAFELYNIPKEGVWIGRADDCQFKIDGSKRNVGRYHAIIGKDTQGMFIQDNHSTNGMYDENRKKVKQLDIKNGMICYLANVKVRFREIDPFENYYFDNKEKTKCYEKESKSRVCRL